MKYYFFFVMISLAFTFVHQTFVNRCLTFGLQTTFRPIGLNFNQVILNSTQVSLFAVSFQ